MRVVGVLPSWRPPGRLLPVPAGHLVACLPAGRPAPAGERELMLIDQPQPATAPIKIPEHYYVGGMLGRRAAPADDVHALPGVPAGDWPRPVAHIPRPYVRQEHAALRHVTCLRLCLPFHEKSILFLAIARDSIMSVGHVPRFAPFVIFQMYSFVLCFFILLYLSI